MSDTELLYAKAVHFDQKREIEKLKQELSEALQRIATLEGEIKGLEEKVGALDELTDICCSDAQMYKKQRDDNKAEYETYTRQYADKLHDQAALIKRQGELLEKVRIYLSVQQHSYWQMVKQLDGEVRNEMIPTQAKKLYDELNELQPSGGG